MIRLLPIAIFALIATLLFGALLSQNNKKSAETGPLVGQTMGVLPLVDAARAAAPLNTRDFVGSVTLINLLASWCAPCEAEMSELVALKKSYPDIRFIGIAWNDAPKSFEPWLREHGNPFDSMRYDPEGRAAIALGVRGIPETYVVDATGTIRYQLSGPITDNMRRQELGPLLETLQAEAAGAR